MGQDIREMFRNEEQDNRSALPKGHQKRFLEKLNEEMPSEERSLGWNQLLKVAAVIVVILAAGLFFISRTSSEEAGNQIVDTETQPVKASEEKNESDYRLSDVSPEFKKVEDYYLASLNIQLAKIDLTPENKELVDSFMSKLETLDQEYVALNTEIEQSGINEETIEAMIANLQLRLDLLKKLKTKLNELKQSKNEHYENYQA
ncbi:hypothetical protein [Christiangramia flava]|uniref:Uncharacterized protein n=1 Tax=Christiangramia flava JLT2011 TaxID=1229726 RepID=A0A1L7I7J1_9FLAO|nr:hypothetical protein [Christiangramia flava]APU69072.1 hypothetical protein GRFL_2348 [Christiangramia flava JLT2011]OSS38327.1 hypothetical protein C723_2811 [Christiangramia flava JLT2011]